jgi:hypothetical protein
MVASMSLGRLPLVVLFVGWAAGCGERAGDAVVRVDPIEAGGAGGGGNGQGGSATLPAGGEAPDTAQGPTGLCGACDDSSQCGDDNDVCLRHDGMSFCGRDCDEGFGCPDDYTCVELANSRLRQCVPVNACPDPADPPPALESVREHVLELINAERVARGSAPFEPSSCLDQLAQESALDYAFSGEPLGTYARECDPIWPNCDCNWDAQAEVQVAHYGLDWLDSIERALRDDRFARAFLEFDVTLVGVGFWISGDEAWIALSFS